MDAAISLSNVTVRRASQSVLDGIDFSVPKGSLTVLLGASGTGKTTFFQLLTGEILPTSGRVQAGMWELPLRSGGQRAQYRRSIGVVFQDVPLLNDRTTEDQIFLPLELMGIGKKRRQEMMKKILERFELAPVRNAYPKELSMGMRQRVAIARAVVAEPLLLLADEPAAHLDSVAQEEIAGIFQREHLRGMTILIATNDEHFASRFPAGSVQLFLDINHPLPPSFGKLRTGT